LTTTDLRARARIDLGALRHNFGVVRDAVGTEVEICAVVKADGYGHGLWDCMSELVRTGVDRVAVATAEEAVAAREVSSDTPIVILGVLTRRELEVAVSVGAEISVWDEAFLVDVADVSLRKGRTTRIHLKLDSGMGRLGSRDTDLVARLADVAASSDGLELEALWTHFATADELEGEGEAFFGDQLDRFLEVGQRLKASHPDLMLHAANSAALLREPATHLDMVRPGVALYGLDPFGGDPADRDLRPVMTLLSGVGAVRVVEPGDSVGYGRKWRAERPTEIATVPIGYGDGYRRGLSGRSEVIIGGTRFPVAGTVSMDNIAVDLGPPGTSGVSAGHEVILIGGTSEPILAEDLARILDTINYEITCGISPRVPREAHGASE
jgi:alanine racemase